MITGSYNPVGFQEILNYFLGFGSSSINPATKEEQETFFSLLNSKQELAVDFLNCWLILKNKEPLPFKSLTDVQLSGTIKSISK